MRFEDRLLSRHFVDRSDDWNTAYPLGNGTLGVMLDGGVREENLYFNDDSFWSGTFEGPTFRSNDVFPKVKALTLEGKLKEAEDILYKEVYGEYVESYLPLCKMTIKREGLHVDKSQYARCLDISSAVYTMKTQGVEEEAFASHVDKVYAMKIDTVRGVEHAFNISCNFKNEHTYKIVNGVGIMEMTVIAPSHKDPLGHEQEHPIIYDDRPSIHAYIKVAFLTDGKILSDNCIKISGATYIRMYFAATTNHRDEDMEKIVGNIIDSALNKSYDDIKKAHIADYKALYDRVRLDMRGDNIDNIDTVTALKRQGKNPKVATLMFNYARYLMIAASRADSNLMNLQGIWNAKPSPNWSSAYTVNVNIEMNYSIAESTNLSECHMPLMRQLKVMEKSGRRTAREQLHNAGWVCGHNSDIWGHTNLAGRTSTFNPSQYALFLSGGAWLARDIYEHYIYTGDVDFLREYYYILRGSAEFYLDYLMKDNESDYLIMCPSASPENTFKHNGERHSISKNATMETAIARDILSTVVKCSEILGEDMEFASRCKDTITKLYPYKIGKHGELLEWYDNYDETEKAHRHISHLYGLYPSSDITIDKTPELAKACLVTLKRRGNKGIGWSLAWRTEVFARLREGEKAWKTLLNKMKYYDERQHGLHYGGCYANLFTAPPMQVDGNFGCAAAIKEMLLQDYDDIRLLPALPKKWQSGAFSGLKVRGGYTVDCAWNNGRVTSFKVSGKGDNIDVIVNGSKINVSLNKEIKL